MNVQVMLLDAETTPIVSLAFAQSALMKQVTKITQILKKSGYYRRSGVLLILMLWQRRRFPIQQIGESTSTVRYLTYCSTVHSTFTSIPVRYLVPYLLWKLGGRLDQYRSRILTLSP
jgi:hypothetical protein